MLKTQADLRNCISHTIPGIKLGNSRLFFVTFITAMCLTPAGQEEPPKGHHKPFPIWQGQWLGWEHPLRWGGAGLEYSAGIPFPPPVHPWGPHHISKTKEEIQQHNPKPSPSKDSCIGESNAQAAERARLPPSHNRLGQSKITFLQKSTGSSESS